MEKPGLYVKTCSQCNQTKDASLFFKHNQTKDGLHSWCKDCFKIGNLKSREKVYNSIEKRAVVFLQNAKKSALKRNQEFNLTTQDILDCWEQQAQTCPYSGRLLTLEPNKLNTVSIERIDSSIGYVPKNTILVCQAVNRMKSNFSLSEFFNLCKDVNLFLTDEQGKPVLETL